MPKPESNVSVPEFVSHIVKDPNKHVETLLLSGFFGPSSEKEHTRLYFDAELSQYVEIPNKAILYSQQMPPAVSPLGGAYVWIEHEAQLVHGKAGAQRAKAKFFEGPIAEAAGGAYGLPPTPSAPICTAQVTPCGPCTQAPACPTHAPPCTVGPPCPTHLQTPCVPCVTHQLTPCLPCPTHQQTPCVPCLTHQQTPCVPCLSQVAPCTPACPTHLLTPCPPCLTQHQPCLTPAATQCGPCLTPECPVTPALGCHNTIAGCPTGVVCNTVACPVTPAAACHVTLAGCPSGVACNTAACNTPACGITAACGVTAGCGPGFGQ
jgi:hypothetical protein